ncbi:DUF4347 domain-containing protein [Gloeocapsa sp. PCC 73106]|uniref:DUF4347 domain-containing protein n=1 Tax=Gloeocapsa sp. PCC 73106 TaxID=102232 RepID=UPI0002ACAE19|nr:DUF4347 domain-containing protein [Gloeocapsa sp. PCC 73106]ELR98279.1 putative calcium-binding protein [Gloeocapsa sp. PCC 73106]
MNNYLISQPTLVVIDAEIENIELLATGLSPSARLLILNPDRDGVQQITAALKRFPDVSSLHLVSHGTPGCLYLGNIRLNLETIANYAPQFKTWKNLTNLLVYGCQVAAGKIGQDFLQRLHQLIPNNLAASTQRVGNLAKGGSWDLDYRIGTFDHEELAFLPEVREIYGGVFDPVVSFEAEPLILFESEQTVLTFGFNLSELPPGEGLTVMVTGDVPQNLNQLDLFDVTVNGGGFPVPDFDNTGFEFNITDQTATISSPIFSDEDEEGASDVTYTLLPGEGYTVDPEANSVTVTFADTPDDIPEPEPEIEVSFTAEPLTLIASEGTVTTLTFELSEPPPSEGIAIPVQSDTSDVLSRFDVDGIVLSGADNLTPNQDSSGFIINITEQEAALTIPVQDSEVENAQETVNFSIESGEGYTVNPEQSAVSFTIIEESMVNEIVGTDDAELLSGTNDRDVIFGRGGNDTLEGLDGDDDLDGGSDDDLIQGDEGNDLLIGRAGNDLLNGGPGNDTMRGGNGDDYYIVDSVDDVTENENDNNDIDTVESSVDWDLRDSRNIENLILTSDRFTTGTGNNLDNEILGSNARNRLSGRQGDDRINGRRGDDRLTGAGGDDTLLGGFGDDSLSGGKGRDRFRFTNLRHGVDTITDFDLDRDFIQLSDSGFEGLNDEVQLLTIPSLDDFEGDFSLGLVYGTSDGSLAYINTQQEIELTQIAILSDAPELTSGNIEIV